MGLGGYIAQGLGLAHTPESSTKVETKATHTIEDLAATPSINTTAATPSVTEIRTIVHTSIIPTLLAGNSTGEAGTTHPSNQSTPTHTFHKAFATSVHLLGTASNGFLNYTNNHTTSLAATGSGFHYANACNQALYTWSKRYLTWSFGYCEDGVVTPTAGTLPIAGPDQIYTTCDGIPRVMDNFTTAAVPWTRHCNAASTLPNAPPKPTCSIRATDCSSLHQSFSSAHGVPSNVGIV